MKFRRPQSPALRALVLLAGLAFLPPTATAQQVPAGFVDELVLGGFSAPVGFAFLPDGRMLVVEKISGRVHVATVSTSAIACVVPGVSAAHVEQGLLGVAVDPSWPAWPYVYLMYDHAQPASLRIVRYTATGDLSDPQSTNLTLGSPHFILSDIPDASVIHNGGTLRFGPDGMLYASVGDDLQSCSAQDPDALTGKILRLDVTSQHGLTGSGPPARADLAAPGNPFTGANAQLVWAYGFRNPFRFNVDPMDGSLIVCDVGASSWEEVNRVGGPGENFGWPIFEGPAAMSICPGLFPTLVPPLASYANPGGAAVVSFGGPYRNLVGRPFQFGQPYEQSVFYLDFFAGWLRRLERVGSTWLPATPVAGQPDANDWGIGYFAVADALQGPDGALYYVKAAPGSIRRIRPAGTPVLMRAISGDQQVGNAGWPAFAPFVVEVANLAGHPLSGKPVTFSVLTGGGQLDPQPVLTGPDGRAQTGYTLPVSTSSNPIVIQASTPGSPPVYFSVTWRGLEADYDPAADLLTITVRHSQPAAPFTLVAHPAPGVLWGTTWGDILVNLWSAPPGWLALDGLGLFGQPNPIAYVGAGSPVWTISVPGISGPPSGLLYVAQAFALDTTRLPDPSAIMVSNGVTILLN